MTGAAPIPAAEIGPILEALCPRALGAIAVAVSGGPDSLALTVLTREWARADGRAICCLTVDHGLRPEARAEAEDVARKLRDSGLSAHVLHYDGPRPVRDIQAAARAIRFGLIADWMTARGMRALLLGHHREDQAETVLLRLARGSGVDGLAAMAPVTKRDGLTLIRPLLDFPKARLVSTATTAGFAPIRDPSNADAAHARVRIRSLADRLAAEGMTPDRLADTARRMARARAALEQARDRYLSDHVVAHPAGYARFDAARFADLPEEVGLRALSHLIRVLGGSDYPPRESRVEALHRAIAAETLRGGRTLAGTRIQPCRSGVLICREASAVAGSVPLAGTTRWDNRFVGRLRDPEAAADTTLGALGCDGLAHAKVVAPDALAALPGAVRPALPALRHRGRTVSLPHLGWSAEAGVPAGEIAFRPVSGAWGREFRRGLPFSKRDEGPI